MIVRIAKCEDPDRHPTTLKHEMDPSIDKDRKSICMGERFQDYFYATKNSLF